MRCGMKPTLLLLPRGYALARKLHRISVAQDRVVQEGAYLRTTGPQQRRTCGTGTESLGRVAGGLLWSLPKACHDRVLDQLGLGIADTLGLMIRTESTRSPGGGGGKVHHELWEH